jgi:S1-C subfamily serine protease
MGQEQFLKQSCYKLMFYMGITDVLCLICNCFFTGLFAILGYVHCSAPDLIFYVGFVAEGNLTFIPKNRQKTVKIFSPVGDSVILWFGEVRRGLLGVTIQTIDAESAEALGTDIESGALVSDIVPGSAAEEAGLKVDDIIVKVNDRRIDNNRELANAIGLKGAGEIVDIEFVRDGRHRTVKATLGQQTLTQSVGDEIHPGLSGAQFASASTSGNSGVEVTEVEPGSPAAQRGLRAGDVIIQVNRRPIQTLQQLQEIAENNRILFLLVQRGDRSLMLQIR